MTASGVRQWARRRDFARRQPRLPIAFVPLVRWARTLVRRPGRGYCTPSSSERRASDMARAGLLMKMSIEGLLARAVAASFPNLALRCRPGIRHLPYLAPGSWPPGGVARLTAVRRVSRDRG